MSFQMKPSWESVECPRCHWKGSITLDLRLLEAFDDALARLEQMDI